ncbi:MAG: hypothetical protein ACXVXU_01505 [Blastococcus sp.]
MNAPPGSATEIRDDLAVPTSHTWTGDPARTPFDANPAVTFVEGTTTALRVRRQGAVRVFTRRYRTVLFAFLVVFGGILSTGPTSEFWAGDPEGIRISTAVIALAFGIAGWRTIRLGITVGPGRVTVRNFWATRWVDTDDVVRFDPPRGVFRGGIRVVKKNGRYISASAFGRMNNFEPADRGVLETAELNAWLAADTSRRPANEPLVPIRGFGRRASLLWRTWLAMVWLLTIMAVAGAVTNMISPEF